MHYCLQSTHNTYTKYTHTSLERVCSALALKRSLSTVRSLYAHGISNSMHGDRGNPKIVWLMLVVCAVLHAVVIPIWMHSLGL